MSSRHKAEGILAAVLLAAPTTAAAAGSLEASPRPPEPIWGGQPNATCEWPSAVEVKTSELDCTGTLVHPRVVLTAAHCLAGHAFIRFGEDTQNQQHEIEATCTAYPDVSTWENDVMFCLLDEPASQAVFTPPMMGCELDQLVDGASVVITGYGKDENGVRGIKRVAEASILDVQPGHVDIGDPGVSPCHGDSGGPAFIQLPDGSWRVFGIVHGRYDVDPFSPPPPDLCGAWAGYVRMDPWIGWVEEKTGIDITPCHDADGTWNPGPDCGGFPTASGAGGSWDDWCAGIPVSGPSATCGDPYGGSTGTGGGSGSGSGSGGDEGSAGSTGGGGTGGEGSTGNVASGEGSGAGFVGDDAGSASGQRGGGGAGGCRLGGSRPAGSGWPVLIVVPGLLVRRRR